MIRSLRQFLLSYGRRALAALLVLFALFMLVTGILLNHSREFGLERPLQSHWLRARYESRLPSVEKTTGLVHRLPAGDLEVRSGELLLDGRRLGTCPRLIGVVEQAGQILVVCSGHLLLLTPEGELIREADNLRGIPEGLSAVARDRDKVLLHGSESSFAVDLQDLSVRPVAPPPGRASPAPDAAGVAVPTRREVVRDLHSGRLLGSWGAWLLDALALLFAVLVIPALLARYRGRA